MMETAKKHRFLHRLNVHGRQN